MEQVPLDIQMIAATSVDRIQLPEALASRFAMLTIPRRDNQIDDLIHQAQQRQQEQRQLLDLMIQLKRGPRERVCSNYDEYLRALEFESLYPSGTKISYISK